MQFRVGSSEVQHEDGFVTSLLDVRGLTVELPTPAGCIRPVNEVRWQNVFERNGGGAVHGG